MSNKRVIKQNGLYYAERWNGIGWERIPMCFESMELAINTLTKVGYSTLDGPEIVWEE